MMKTKRKIYKCLTSNLNNGDLNNLRQMYGAKFNMKATKKVVIPYSQSVYVCVYDDSHALENVLVAQVIK